ncbi:MAG: TonB-dependent receptor, partial [Pseudomonadota bacterium]
EYDSYGFEVSLDGRDGEGFDWRVDYTFNDIDETFTDNLFANAEFGERTPKHKARVELGYNTGPFDLNLIGQVRSGVDFFDGASVVERDTAVTVDARAGYQVSEQVEMFVVGENLTGTNSFGNGGTDEDTRFRIGVRFAL